MCLLWISSDRAIIAGHSDSVMRIPKYWCQGVICVEICCLNVAISERLNFANRILIIHEIHSLHK